MCGCSFKKGETCLRCEQNHEYQQSLLNDCAKTATAEELDLEEEESEGENLASLVSLDDMRELRVAHFQAAIVSETVQDSVATSGVLCEEGNSSTSNTVVSGPGYPLKKLLLDLVFCMKRQTPVQDQGALFQSERRPWCNVNNSAPFTNLQ